jgi:hypothetical protein
VLAIVLIAFMLSYAFVLDCIEAENLENLDVCITIVAIFAAACGGAVTHLAIKK